VIPASHPNETPRWGLRDAVVAYLMAFVGSVLLVAVVRDPDHLSLEESVLLNLPLWIFTIGFPIWATRTKGRGPVEDLGLRIRWYDVPMGIAAGLAAQLVLPFLYGLFVSDRTLDRLDDPARALADSAGSTWAKVLFALTTVLVAPFAEELFYRGLILRSIERKAGVWPALAITTVIFAVLHFQGLQLVGLVVAGGVFGVLAVVTGRLGPAMAAHMAFNGLAVWQLLR
jgi:membrane protease YdiL (CAAX protease family)